MSETENNSLIPNNPLAVFAQAKDQIALLALQCKQIVISSDESLESAENLAKDAKKIEKLIEDRRVEITKPMLDEKKKIDDFAKSITNELSSSIKDLRDQILKYKQEQEAKRKAEQARLDAERKEKEDELRKQMEANEPIAQEQIQELQEIKQQQTIAISSAPTKGISKYWDYDIINVSAMPLDYLCPDEAKIKQAIKDGVREIPGILISQKERLNLR